MDHQLLWLETLLKGSAGAILVLAPLMTAQALGLPRPTGGLWPRILGILLLGIAAALYLEGLKLNQLQHGALGLAGIAAINIVSVFGLAIVLVTNGVRAVRGRVVMWFIVVILAGLSVLELAVA